MKKIIETKNADELFEKLEDEPLFTCKKSVSGITARYNAVFTVIGNPKINIIKLSDTSVKVDFLPNVLMILLAVVITMFFWTIATLGILKDGFPLAGIIIVLVAPTLMWLLEYFFITKISNMILEEIVKLDN